jgi:hypothetical protein
VVSVAEQNPPVGKLFLREQPALLLLPNSPLSRLEQLNARAHQLARTATINALCAGIIPWRYSLRREHRAKARARASLAFALALVPKRCATTQQRWCPKREAPYQAEIELVPVRILPFRRAGEESCKAQQRLTVVGALMSQ